MLNRPPVASMFEEMCRFLALYGQVERKTHDFGEGVVLRPPEMHLLSMVERLGAPSISELAHAAGLTKGAVSQTTAKLEARGFIRKTEDPDNRSRVRTGLTALGRRACKAHETFHGDKDREIFQWFNDMDERDVRFLETVFKRMQDWMQSYLG